MTKKLNWRLKELPTASEIADLVEQKVITAEEAKEMLFKDGVEIDKNREEQLEKQIEFLEGLVTELSKNRTSTVYVNKYVQDWTYRLPNVVYCSSTSTGSGLITANAGSTSLTSYANNLTN